MLGCACALPTCRPSLAAQGHWRQLVTPNPTQAWSVNASHELACGVRVRSASQIRLVLLNHHRFLRFSARCMVCAPVQQTRLRFSSPTNTPHAGALDIMVPEEDVAEQQRRLPNSWRINYDGYTHMDFVWDRNADHALDVVDILFRYAPGTF